MMTLGHWTSQMWSFCEHALNLQCTKAHLFPFLLKFWAGQGWWRISRKAADLKQQLFLKLGRTVPWCVLDPFHNEAPDAYSLCRRMSLETTSRNPDSHPPNVVLLRIPMTYSRHMMAGCLFLNSNFTERKIESEETRKLLITKGLILGMKSYFLAFSKIQLAHTDWWVLAQSIQDLYF